MGNLQEYLDKKQAERHLNKAQGYMELKLWDLAQQELRPVLDQPLREQSQVLAMFGETLRYQEKYADAVPYFEKAILIDSGNIELWLAFAWCEKRVGRIDLAIEAMENALKVDPESTILYYNMACYLALQNDEQGCIKYLSEAMKRVPECRAMAEKESDFDTIRQKETFRQLLRS